MRSTSRDHPHSDLLVEEAHPTVMGIGNALSLNDQMPMQSICMIGHVPDLVCRYQGVVKCSQAIARINRQEIIRSIEELPEPAPAPLLLHAVLPYCVAGDAGSPRKGYLDALQYALTRTPMTKEVLVP